jgi:HAMP domain-containing protein
VAGVHAALMEDGQNEPQNGVLDFVRTKVNGLANENAELRHRLADLESTLAIVQTAQKWSEENAMTPEQAAKVKEVTALIMEARTARQEAQNFSKVGKGGLVEELKSLKNQLRAERDEKRQMKERLKSTFEHAKQLKTDHAAAVQREEAEIAYWRKTLRKVQDRHRDEVEALQTAVGAQAQQAQLRMNQVNSFGSRVMAELSDLHENLKGTSTDTRKVFDEEEISSPVFLTQ